MRWIHSSVAVCPCCLRPIACSIIWLRIIYPYVNTWDKSTPITISSAVPAAAKAPGKEEGDGPKDDCSKDVGDIKTGEEDEDVLFVRRAKMFRFDPEKRCLLLSPAVTAVARLLARLLLSLSATRP